LKKGGSLDNVTNNSLFDDFLDKIAFRDKFERHSINKQFLPDSVQEMKSIADSIINDYLQNEVLFITEEGKNAFKQLMVEYYNKISALTYDGPDPGFNFTNGEINLTKPIDEIDDNILDVVDQDIINTLTNYAIFNLSIPIVKLTNNEITSKFNSNLRNETYNYSITENDGDMLNNLVLNNVLNGNSQIVVNIENDEYSTKRYNKTNLLVQLLFSLENNLGEDKDINNFNKERTNIMQQLDSLYDTKNGEGYLIWRNYLKTINDILDEFVSEINAKASISSQISSSSTQQKSSSSTPQNSSSFTPQTTSGYASQIPSSYIQQPTIGYASQIPSSSNTGRQKRGRDSSDVSPVLDSSDVSPVFMSPSGIPLSNKRENPVPLSNNQEKPISVPYDDSESLNKRPRYPEKIANNQMILGKSIPLPVAPLPVFGGRKRYSRKHKRRRTNKKRKNRRHKMTKRHNRKTRRH
jgi:hypothetical protein